MSVHKTRCAIYTRKSHTEGLDRAFNSLDAQREAGVDYVKSQKHEGWTIVRSHYDDGGYSGGTIQRPALQRLFNDIEAGAIDVVVVYKVDRLSRSLTDFAHIMQRFDGRGVSFVSVTQQFNTSTSMGRLTLNMLLSFAQFERDIAGERIRDKIAATKKKGMWAGGQPPLGYRLPEAGENGKLVVIPAEADLVRRMFAEYIQTHSLITVANRLNADGETTKRWRSKSGRQSGGRRLTSHYIHRVLANEVYLGRVTHTAADRTRSWPGLHDAIIDQDTWDKVQRLMDKQRRRTRHRWTQPYLLKGKLRTGDDFAMSPGSVHRPGRAKNTKRLVRYYVSQRAIKHGYRDCPIKAINAGHIDDLVRALSLDYLASVSVDQLGGQAPAARDHWIRHVIDVVVLTTESLVIRLDPFKVGQCHEIPRSDDPAPEKPAPTCPFRPEIQNHGRQIVMTMAIQIKRLDGRRILLSPDGRDLILPVEPEPSPHIVNAIGLAYRWHETLLSSHGTISKLARQDAISESTVRKLLPLTHLGPAVLSAALKGLLPPSVTLDDLLAAANDLDWTHQLRDLGLDAPSAPAPATRETTTRLSIPGPLPG